MAVTKEDYELLIEPQDEGSDNVKRSQCLETVDSFNDGPASARRTTSTPGKVNIPAKRHTHHALGKWDTRGHGNASGKWDIQEHWESACHPKTSPTRELASLGGSTWFVVGDDREVVVVGDPDKLATVSPVLQTMLGTPRTADQAVEIPDVPIQAFKMIVRFSEKQRVEKLNDHNLWDVVKAADKYQVAPLIRACFHFLLHCHSRRHDAEHLCAVLEMAHSMNCREEHIQCLDQVLQDGSKVLSDASAVGKLCYDCMKDIVKADSLAADEIVVYGAVLTWAASRCGPDSAWKDLRSAAGELIQHVRYLTLPIPTLTRLFQQPPFAVSEGIPLSCLLGHQPFCLLTEEEVNNLIHQKGSLFPPKVHEKRREMMKRGDGQKRGSSKEARRRCMMWVSLICLLLLLAFSVQYALTRFLVAPLVHDMQMTNMSSQSALNQSFHSI